MKYARLPLLISARPCTSTCYCFRMELKLICMHHDANVFCKVAMQHARARGIHENSLIERRSSTHRLPIARGHLLASFLSKKIKNSANCVCAPLLVA